MRPLDPASFSLFPIQLLPSILALLLHSLYESMLGKKYRFRTPLLLYNCPNNN